MFIRNSRILDWEGRRKQNGHVIADVKDTLKCTVRRRILVHNRYVLLNGHFSFDYNPMNHSLTRLVVIFNSSLCTSEKQKDVLSAQHSRSGVPDYRWYFNQTT